MGEEDDNGDITLETDTRSELEEDEVSADELLARLSPMQLVKQVAAQAAVDFHFRFDQSDIEEPLLYELRNIQRIKNPRAYLTSAAGHYCLNRVRHDDIVAGHDE